MTTINQKDADQDQLIALLTHRIEDAEKISEELRERVRNLERWVWRAGAIISATITIIGIAVAIPEDADAFTSDSLTSTPCATTSLSNSFIDEVTIRSLGETNGIDDTPQQEVLLQFQGSGDQPSP